MPNVVSVSNLVKIYKGRLKAVDNVSFSVEAGEIFGLLGPNGAGKTTIIKILATLIRPTEGSVKIFDLDINKDEQEIREIMGYVPQDISVDSALTGYENLLISAKLYDIGKEEREKRINDLLKILELEQWGHRLVRTYSGGMIRKLEIAQVLVHDPKIVLLDEPTVGLDPKSRRMIWDQIEKIRDIYKTTFILTTHYMEEADFLCDRVGIINNGKIMVIDSPENLKKSIGNSYAMVKISGNIKNLDLPGTIVNGEELSFPVSDPETDVPIMIKKLYDNGISVKEMHIRENNLDDVFLKYTGSRIEESHQWRDTKKIRRIARRLA